MKQVTEKQLNTFILSLPPETILSVKREKHERGYIERFYRDGETIPFIVLDVATQFPKCIAKINKG